MGLVFRSTITVPVSKGNGLPRTAQQPKNAGRLKLAFLFGRSDRAQVARSSRQAVIIRMTVVDATPTTVELSILTLVGLLNTRVGPSSTPNPIMKVGYEG